MDFTCALVEKKKEQEAHKKLVEGSHLFSFQLSNSDSLLKTVICKYGNINGAEGHTLYMKQSNRVPMSIRQKKSTVTVTANKQLILKKKILS